jgi:hypothetical protein
MIVQGSKRGAGPDFSAAKRMAVRVSIASRANRVNPDLKGMRPPRLPAISPVLSPQKESDHKIILFVFVVVDSIDSSLTAI